MAREMQLPLYRNGKAPSPAVPRLGAASTSPRESGDGAARATVYALIWHLVTGADHPLRKGREVGEGYK
jgi:hypothetical protein